MRLLVKRGADVNEQHELDDVSLSPLMMAAARNHETTVRALLEQAPT